MDLSYNVNHSQTYSVCPNENNVAYRTFNFVVFARRYAKMFEILRDLSRNGCYRQSAGGERGKTA